MSVRALALAAAAALALASPAAAQTWDFRSPGVSPPGANDFACEPSAEHPVPVVLVHGTYMDMTSTWNLVAPALAADGRCVFALDYGERATQPIEQSAAELGAFVDRVLAATGAERVSMVGHSQGGMMPRWWIRFGGGHGKVDDLIGLAPSNYGTDIPSASYAERYGDCPACGQQIEGSGFLAALNDVDDTPGDTSYTVVETRYDEVVTPYTNAFLRSDEATNVTLQDRCPADASEHLAIVYDPAALQWIRDALARPGPADPGFAPVC